MRICFVCFVLLPYTQSPSPLSISSSLGCGPNSSRTRAVQPTAVPRIASRRGTKKRIRQREKIDKAIGKYAALYVPFLYAASNDRTLK